MRVNTVSLVQKVDLEHAKHPGSLRSFLSCQCDSDVRLIFLVKYIKN